MLVHARPLFVLRRGHVSVSIIGFDEGNEREYVSSADDDDESTDPTGPSGEPFEDPGTGFEEDDPNYDV